MRRPSRYGCIWLHGESSSGKVHQVRNISDELSFEDDVSYGSPCMTAWQGLVNVAKLQRGEKVLIHSAAGATGQMAIQVAHLIGAT